jgi:hypothetical protein
VEHNDQTVGAMRRGRAQVQRSSGDRASAEALEFVIEVEPPAI